MSDSLNVIMELLGIKFNSKLYMSLLNDDEVTFILIFFLYVVLTAFFSFLLQALEQILLLCAYVYCAAFFVLFVRLHSLYS